MLEQGHFGYMGRTLRIDLTTGRITTHDDTGLFRDWLGGSGFAAHLLYTELGDGIDPYDPENIMVISSGALIGTVAPGACKMNISTLGPITGGWATGSCDSYLGIELKHAGYDCLVIRGRAPSPCYISIDDDQVTLKDASSLWGKTTWETLDCLRAEYRDPNMHVISIGPAGENQSRGACIIQDRNRAFGRCGMGAVMGAKNLKAFVCKGSRPIRIAEPERFIAKVTECRTRMKESPALERAGKYGTPGCFRHKQSICGIPYKNFQACMIPEEYADGIDPVPMIDKYQITRQSFPGCVVACGRQMVVTDGPYKGLSTYMNQWEVIGSIMGKLAVREGTFMLKANAYCNELGLDVDIAGGAIGWAMECYERGILTQADTDGMAIHWGDEAVILELIRKMSYREGFGKLLSEGSYRAAEITGKGSEYYAMHVKKQDLYELMRSSNGWCLGTAVSTRGGGHTTGAPTIEQNGSPLSDVVSLKVLGVTSAVAVDPEGYEGKAKVVLYYEVLTRMCNSLGLCIFNSAWWDATFVNLEDIAELLSAAVGEEFTTGDLERIAMRQLNTEKAINLRFTDFARQDDAPPRREMTEPIPAGTRKGWKIDQEKYNWMLDEYYDLHGWDRKTSYPTWKTLEGLGLMHVAEDLAKIGKLGEPAGINERSGRNG